jgi:hypothetical protein
MSLYKFKCPKCSLFVEYNMFLGDSAKNSTTQVCKCPQCKTIITYGDINLFIMKTRKKQMKG